MAIQLDAENSFENIRAVEGPRVAQTIVRVVEIFRSQCVAEVFSEPSKITADHAAQLEKCLLAAFPKF